tara:strand:+ start:101817 stop:101999 length:183 start_codon:yes stop_codon:yes gene_type:complete
MKKTAKWLLFTLWWCLLAAFPVPVLVTHLLLFIAMCFLMWAKIILALIYMVVKYGIFYGF